MLDYPTSIYKFRDNIPEIQGQYPGTPSLESCRNSMPKESQTWINLKNQISKINKVLKQVSSRKLKNQISKFNKVLKQSVKQKSSRIKFQKSTKYQNKVSKQTFHHWFDELHQPWNGEAGIIQYWRVTGTAIIIQPLIQSGWS